MRRSLQNTHCLLVQRHSYINSNFAFKYLNVPIEDLASDIDSATLRKLWENIASWRRGCSPFLMNIYELSCLEIKEICNLSSNTFYRKNYNWLCLLFRFIIFCTTFINTKSRKRPIWFFVDRLVSYLRQCDAWKTAWLQVASNGCAGEYCWVGLILCKLQLIFFFLQKWKLWSLIMLCLEGLYILTVKTSY